MHLAEGDNTAKTLGIIIELRVQRSSRVKWGFLIRLLNALEVVIPFTTEEHDGCELPALFAETVQLCLRGGGSIGNQDFVFDLIHGQDSNSVMLLFKLERLGIDCFA